MYRRNKFFIICTVFSTLVYLGVTLKRTTDERDIGITVRDNLKPSQQCRKAASTVLSQIMRAFHYRDGMARSSWTSTNSM